jgi:hypothetical protein
MYANHIACYGGVGAAYARELNCRPGFSRSILSKGTLGGYQGLL